MNPEQYREKVKEQVLVLLNNPALKEHWYQKGFFTKEMYELFLDKFGYRSYGGVFYDEIWSNNNLLKESPDKDEKYPDGYCFRIRTHLGRDITFLSSIYNKWKDDINEEWKKLNLKQPTRINKEDDLVFVDCELRVSKNKLTNNSFMKYCDLRLLENEINKHTDLSDRWKRLVKSK